MIVALPIITAAAGSVLSMIVRRSIVSRIVPLFVPRMTRMTIVVIPMMMILILGIMIVMTTLLLVIRIMPHFRRWRISTAVAVILRFSPINYYRIIISIIMPSIILHFNDGIGIPIEGSETEVVLDGTAFETAAGCHGGFGGPLVDDVVVGIGLFVVVVVVIQSIFVYAASMMIGRSRTMIMMMVIMVMTITANVMMMMVTVIHKGRRAAFGSNGSLTGGNGGFANRSIIGLYHRRWMMIITRPRRTTGGTRGGGHGRARSPSSTGDDSRRGRSSLRMPRRCRWNGGHVLHLECRGDRCFVGVVVGIVTAATDFVFGRDGDAFFNLHGGCCDSIIDCIGLFLR